MSYEKIGTMVDRLVDNTKSGLVTWEESEIDFVYQVSFPKYSVRICFKNTDSEYEHPDYYIQIINDEGKAIEEVSSSALSSVIDDPYNKMKEMHDIARRQVLGVEEALDSILSNLKDSDEFPF